MKPTPREINKPQPGIFKMRLVRNGPWVGARIGNDSGKWFAIVNNQYVAEGIDDPASCSEIIKIWTFARDTTPEEYRALTRSDRGIDPTETVNLTTKASIF